MVSSARHNAFLWQNRYNRPMKKELPIASILLAVGALLWISSSYSSNDVANGAERLPDTPPTAGLNEQIGTQASSSNLLALTQKPAIQAPQEPAKTDPWLKQQLNESQSIDRSMEQVELELPSNQTDIGTPSAGDYWHPTSDARTIDFLRRVARQTAASQPLGTAIQLEANLFGQTIEATGRYFQAGQGTHKSRLELRFGGAKAAAKSEGPTIFQMCDGRFIYRLETIHDQQAFSFVDLNRIQDKTGEGASSFSPTGWVATGELSSMYQQLGSAFNFGSPHELENGDVLIRGSWSETALRRTLNSEDVIDPTGSAAGGAKIRWDKVPPQLPHGVEFVFSKDPLAGHFPKQITLVRFHQNNETHSIETLPMLSVAFSKPQPIEEVNDRMFVIDSKNTESTDVTEHYLARVRAFQKQRLAERKGQLER